MAICVRILVTLEFAQKGAHCEACKYTRSSKIE